MLVPLSFKCCVCYRNKPTLVIKMFRSMRFCHFLTNNYCKVGSVGRDNLLNLSRISSILPPICSVQKKSTAEFFNDLNFEERDTYRLTYSETGKYWHEFLTSDRDDIIWDVCLTGSKVPKENDVNSHALILLFCREKKLYRCAISFFHYLWEKKELTAGLLNLFCDFALDNPEIFTCCNDIIFQIFTNVVHTDKIAAKICSKILVQSPKYSKIVYGSYMNHMSDEKNHTGMVLSLIQANKMDEALDVYILGNARMFWIEKLFLDHFLDETIKGKNIVPAICKFLSETEKINSDLFITDENISILQDLFMRLDAMDENYTWIVDKRKPNSNYCPACNGKLIQTHVRTKEISKLLKDLEENVIFQGNIFMKSSKEEWQRFCDFIKTANYNMVLDGLNVMYSLNDYGKFEHLVNKISYNGLTPLVLARVHFQTLPEYNLVKTIFPVFLTENLSDDDVFVLYAALKKGKGCLTLSNDKMRFCRELLSPEVIDVYKRWQATHQCRVSHKHSIIFPDNLANGLQKCVESQEDEFRYHYVALQNRASPILICVSRIKNVKELKTFKEIQDRKIKF